MLARGFLVRVAEVVCAVQDEIIHRLDRSLQLSLYLTNAPVGPVTPQEDLRSMTRPYLFRVT